MSGKSPSPGERGRTTAPKATTAPGVTTRSRSRGQNRPTPYPVHPPGTSSLGAPSGPAFHPRTPQATPSPRGAPCGPSIYPRAPQVPPTPRRALFGSDIRPTRPQSTPLQSGGVKRAPPRGSGSPTKRGPASPPPPSRGKTPSPLHSRELPGTPSRGITDGLARCTIGKQGMPSSGEVSQGPPTRPQGPSVIPSWAGVAQGPTTRSKGLQGTPSRGVIVQRY